MTKKKMYIRNDIVYDPNIDFPSPFDYDFEEVTEHRKRYRSGKGKRKEYTE